MQDRPRDVRDDLRIHLAAAFQDAEHDRLPSRASSALATHPSRAEVRFIDLHGPAQRGGGLAGFRDPSTHDATEPVDRVAVQVRRFRDLRGREIERKQLQELAEFGVRNL